MSRNESPRTVAAVDLGSNSFHMLIARLDETGVRVLDRLREPVRLAAGLDAGGRITPEAAARALGCLARFGERLRELPPEQVRAVGTNTLRRAANAAEFREAAERALGHAIEVISGVEEARLIYLGVHTSSPPVAGRRLVVDIGGGSTEVILGEGPAILRAHSLFMGCVTWSERFFGDGITREAFRRAETAAELEIQPIAARLREIGWKSAAGASGTIAAIARLVARSEPRRRGVDLEALKTLRRRMIERAAAGKGPPRGVRAERAAVLPGGLAILIGLLRGLGISALRPAPGALREGLLYDLAGRLRHEDVREATVDQMMQRFGVDREHALRVERTALALLEQAASSWRLEGRRARRMLAWAARLREIGLTVSFTGYHKHSAYLIGHGDMPGFTRDEQLELAAIIRAHRRRIPRAAFDGLGRKRAARALRLCVLLRLAARLRRSRSREPLPELRLAVDGDSLRLGIPSGWLRDHPLVRADLENEARYLEAAGLRFEIETEDPS
ncbi:MAG: exopolyphosphatase [Acidobacteriota bacterium]